jgi:hypothetical protein
MTNEHPTSSMDYPLSNGDMRDLNTRPLDQPDVLPLDHPEQPQMTGIFWTLEFNHNHMSLRIFKQSSSGGTERERERVRLRE